MVKHLDSVQQWPGSVLCKGVSHATDILFSAYVNWQLSPGEHFPASLLCISRAITYTEKRRARKGPLFNTDWYLTHVVTPNKQISVDLLEEHQVMWNATAEHNTETICFNPSDVRPALRMEGSVCVSAKLDNYVLLFNLHILIGRDIVNPGSLFAKPSLVGLDCSRGWRDIKVKTSKPGDLAQQTYG